MVDESNRLSIMLSVNQATFLLSLLQVFDYPIDCYYKHRHQIGKTNFLQLSISKSQCYLTLTDIEELV